MSEHDKRDYLFSDDFYNNLKEIDTDVFRSDYLVGKTDDLKGSPRKVIKEQSSENWVSEFCSMYRLSFFGKGVMEEEKNVVYFEKEIFIPEWVIKIDADMQVITVSYKIGKYNFLVDLEKFQEITMLIVGEYIYKLIIKKFNEER